MTDEEKQLREENRLLMQKEVASDIELMDSIMDGNPPPDVTVEEEDEPKVQEDESQNKVVAEAGVEDLKDDLQAAAAAEEVPVDKPVEEAKDEDEYDFSFINELARQAMGAPQSVQATQAPAAQTKEQEIPPAVQPQAIAKVPEFDPTNLTVQVPADLVDLKAMQEAFDSPEKMIELIGKVYARAVADATIMGTQRSLMSLPQVVRPLVKQEAAMVERVTNFYKENPELVGYRDFVSYCGSQVENAHPDWTPEKVFAETAILAKKRLPMLREAMGRQQKTTVKPSFVDQKSSKTKPSATKVSRLQQDLDAMPDY